MSEEQDLNQTNPEALATSSAESAELDSQSDDPAFAAMVKRYGFTPQQAKEVMLYLQRNKRKQQLFRECV